MPHILSIVCWFSSVVVVVAIQCIRFCVRISLRKFYQKKMYAHTQTHTHTFSRRNIEKVLVPFSKSLTMHKDLNSTCLHKWACSFQVFEFNMTFWFTTETLGILSYNWCQAIFRSESENNSNNNDDHNEILCVQPKTITLYPNCIFFYFIIIGKQAQQRIKFCV